MIVCLCKAVDEKKLRGLLVDGCSVRDVMLQTGAGTDCGTCVRSMVAISDEEKQKKADASKACHDSCGCPAAAQSDSSKPG